MRLDLYLVRLHDHVNLNVSVTEKMLATVRLLPRKKKSMISLGRTFNFSHIRTVQHLDIIKVLFIRQPMHQ